MQASLRQAASAQGPGPPKKGSSLGQRQCAFCERKGHWEKNCPLLKREKLPSKLPEPVSQMHENEECRGPEDISPAKPLVIAKLGEDNVEFLVDTRATYSVLNTLEGKLSRDTVRVVGATGVTETRPFFQPLKFKLGKHWVTHLFLYMPNSPKSLLGRDLLEKLEAEIKFTKGGEIKVIIPETKYMEAATPFVQESRSEIPIEVEKAEDIYPVVANPYTLLTRLTDNLGWFTVLDLKDAFFCIPVHKDSQELFAFEWDNPETGCKVQLTWSVLPQGFKNSPAIFGNQLAIQLTISLLNFIGQSGYRVTKGKVQIAKETVVYVGLEIFRGHRRLSTEQKKVICDLPELCTVREMQAFLGMVNWCRL
ncbi:hypothetical protein WISP_17381 [Willisornis vidua]|uniref:ribonuclease H n=1 Tax=Willisornis vidua TaxID=1566151 RepID=A0ABQ9DTW9_9PASS|nr:hypothetical protein WISP_17381 [Willisornis vidua]